MFFRIGLTLSIFVVIFIIVMGIKWSLKIPAEIDGIQLLQELEFKFEDQPDSEFHFVSLPHNWDKEEPDLGGIGVYRATLSLVNIPQGSIGFYLPKVSMNAEILWNGAIIGSGGSMQEPVARYWNQPLYLTLPAGFWNEGENIVEIKVFGFPNGRSGLGAIFVGQNLKLFSHFETYRLKLMLLDVGSFSIALVLGLMLLFWARKTRELALFYFAVGALLSCVVIADSFWIEVPFSRFIWRWFTHICIAFSMIFYYLFMLRMISRKLGFFEKFAIFYLSAGSFILCFAEQGQLLPWAKWLHMVSLMIMIQLIYLSLKSWLTVANAMHLWLGACMFIVLTFGLLDWIPAVLNMATSYPYLYYIGPMAFSFAVSIGLLSRYVRALESESNHSEILKKSLKSQQKRLDKQHHQIVQFENDRVVHEERDRIVRELHDGIGGQLMGALTLSENKDAVIEK